MARNSYRSQPNCWMRSRWPWMFPPGWPRGFYTAQRKLASKAYYPGSKERAIVASGYIVEPFWNVVNVAPLSRESLKDAFLPQGDDTFLAFIATASSSPATPVGSDFQSRLYQVFDANSGLRMSRGGVNMGNMFGGMKGGGGAQPFVLRSPYFPGNLRLLSIQVSNAQTTTNTIQCCIYGVRRRVWGSIGVSDQATAKEGNPQ